ncbi:MAG: GNAT family N-acetyltransferase [Christensenella sp.]|nr:GNAT family N-acetyltransferase [Christensenella sp.]
MSLLKRIAPLFSGWDETLIWSVLEGHMGFALADDEQNPTSAQVAIGDICFFAGRPDEMLAAKAGAPELVPQDDGWCAAIERVWGEKVQRRLRYAIKKEPDIFNRGTLQYYVDSLPEEYELRLFDETIYAQSFQERWSQDFCGCFNGCEDFMRRGLGAAVLHHGKLVSGASSYSVYNGGFEIEIDTMPEYRQRGLATVCGARLILEALKRGLYPSWDAFDLRSVALAEKLGYHVDHPYAMYSML